MAGSRSCFYCHVDVAALAAVVAATLLLVCSAVAAAAVIVGVIISSVSSSAVIIIAPILGAHVCTLLLVRELLGLESLQCQLLGLCMYVLVSGWKWSKLKDRPSGSGLDPVRGAFYLAFLQTLVNSGVYTPASLAQCL